MSELTDILDEMVKAMVETMPPEAIAKVAVGYFAAVEAWASNPGAPEGLLWYHKTTTGDLIGDASRENT